MAIIYHQDSLLGEVEPMNPQQNQELNHLLTCIYRTFEAGVTQGTEAADELGMTIK